MYEMNLRSVSDIIHRGGTMLYSARSKEFCTEAGMQKAIDVCREIGIDISAHRSQRLNPEIAEKTDLFAVMTPSHKSFLLSCGIPAEKIAVLGDIPDPYGGDEDEYRNCRDQIDREVQTLLKDCVQRLNGQPTEQ